MRMTRAGAQGDAAGTVRAGSLPISAFPAADGQNPAADGAQGDAAGRHALAPCQYPPFPRDTGKNRRAQGDAADKTRGTEG